MSHLTRPEEINSALAVKLQGASQYISTDGVVSVINEVQDYMQLINREGELATDSYAD